MALKFKFLFLLLMISLVFTSCITQNTLNDNSEKIEVFYSNSNTNGFNVKKYEIKKLTPDAVMESVKNNQPIPKDVKVNNFKETKVNGKKILEVDLSNEFSLKQIGKPSEYAIIGSICNTFLTAYDADLIKITVNNKILISDNYSYDDYLGYFDGKNDKNVTKKDPIEIIVYSANKTLENFEMRNEKIKRLAPDAVIDAIKKHQSISKSISVNSFKELLINGKKALDLDLSKEFSLNTLGTSSEYFTLGSIVNTFLSAYSAELIKITVDSKPLTSGHAIYEDYLEMFNNNFSGAKESTKTIDVYSSNSNADGFIANSFKLYDLTSENVLESIKTFNSISKSIKVNSFNETTVDEKRALDLDLSKEFSLNGLGSAGEYMVLGSIVNTFLKAYDADLIKITVNGETLASDHQIYSYYLSFYEDQTTPQLEPIDADTTEEINSTVSVDTPQATDDTELTGTEDKSLLIKVYYINSSVTGFDTSNYKLDELTAANVLTAIKNFQDLPDGAYVNNFEVTEFNGQKALNLDLSQEFSLNGLNTSVEFGTIGSIVNTFLNAYGAEYIKITVNENPIITDNGDYSDYTGYFN